MVSQWTKERAARQPAIQVQAGDLGCCSGTPEEAFSIDAGQSACGMLSRLKREVALHGGQAGCSP